MNLRPVLDFIERTWSATVRQPADIVDNELPLVAPYTVPTASPMFHVFFYWDTYFTNVGLRLAGYDELAAGNVENFLYLLETYGFIPNYTRPSGLHRSQPPVASQAVREQFACTGDLAWLARAYQALCREHAFWTTMRACPSGLNHYGHHAPPQYLYAFAEVVAPRLGGLPHPPAERLASLGHTLAEAETGWDFNPRFARRCADFAAVDLNSLLFQMEDNLAHFAGNLGLEAQGTWEAARDRRRHLIDSLLWDEERGAYYDYDTVAGRRGDCLSAAAFFPLWTGHASPQQAAAVASRLAELECSYGLTTCEPGPREQTYQWDYPNGWPPMQYVAIEGLRRYGYHTDANRLAEKYLDAVCRNFAATGNLWEKYNVVTGGVDVNDEYAMPPMLGWTAGVFLHCAALLAEESP